MESNALRRWRRAFFAGTACVLAAACGNAERGDAGDDRSRAGRPATGGASAPDDFGNANGSGGNGAATAIDAGANATRDGAMPDTCAVTSASAEFEPVYLAFAFDVSGSMGKGDEEWHDKSLKWDPVVAATRAFFEDPASKGLTASLTFFPAEGDDDDRCIESAYETPDVALTALPSNAFGDAIAAIEPKSEGDWRGGTPTAWVMRGTLAFIAQQRKTQPGRYAIVLVTDGYPQGCDDEDDTIEAVVAEAKAARDDAIATYVIGVANPDIDGAPDTVTDLHAIASAGGTDQALLIDTGDPTQTTDAFGQAVQQIRSASITCDLAIPSPPDGDTFDKERVAVTYDSAATTHTLLHYDAACAGENAWRYDDPRDPSSIVLCDSTCETVQADPNAALHVQFACEQLFSLD